MAVLIIADKSETTIIDGADWLWSLGIDFYVADFHVFIKDYFIEKKLDNEKEILILYNQKTGKKVHITGLWYRRNTV